ncbi:unnamed protein product [Ambrosiozyma monospora]|uniref:Unnamed protein product n=1 Tax=Ambrosiozyma monospora TaxID=43982 RepID=A0ACB5T1S2_AMBMO|nr:unnamed protein product [Ambrosiozyma monospora]
MDSKGYLKHYGWQEGQALKKGGLKKPILVKHKYDNKGIGHGSNEAEAWWERVFDGQLKSLSVTPGDSRSGSGTSTPKSGGISFNQGVVVASGVSKSVSPLYRMFVRGEGLAGTIGTNDGIILKNKIVKMSDTNEKANVNIQETDEQLVFFNLSSDSESESEADEEKKKSLKKTKKTKKTKNKGSKDKKEKKSHKHKKDGKGKDKKENSKDKKHKNGKDETGRKEKSKDKDHKKSKKRNHEDHDSDEKKKKKSKK